MRKSEIRVGATYRRYNSKGKAFDRKATAIFNDTVLYGVPHPSRNYVSADKNCSLKAFARWAEAEVEAPSEDRYDRLAFLDKCRTLVEKHGLSYGEAPSRVLNYLYQSTDRFSPRTGRTYCDDQIVIVTTTQNGSMYVERLENSNPVIYVDETGSPFRYHGEYSYLVDHVNSLLEA